MSLSGTKRTNSIAAAMSNERTDRRPTSRARFNATQSGSIMWIHAARGQFEAAPIMLGVSGWQRS